MKTRYSKANRRENGSGRRTQLALKIGCGLLATCLLLSTAAVAEEHAGSKDERMAWWREARFGMFIHWGLYSVAGGEWEGRRNEEIASWMMHEFRIPPDQYETLMSGFTAERYRPAEWAALAKRAGMKYAVFTAKHHEGFSLFDTKHTDYNVMNTPAGRDVTSEYLAAFRAAGLRAGLYFTLFDWHHPEYPVKGDGLHPMRDDPVFQEQPRDLDKYLDFMHAQVRELLEGYGQVDVMWWDFSYGNMHGEAWRTQDLVEMCLKLQPGIVMNNRTHLDSHINAEGDFATAEQFVPPDGIPGLDWETCMTINNTWGYKPHDLDYKSSLTLIRTLVDVVSKGGNFLLNVGPRPDGTIPETQVERLEDIGDWMAVNGDAIYGTTASPFSERLPWGRATTKLNDDGTALLYLHVFDWPSSRDILLPPLANQIQGVSMMDGGEALAFSETNEGILIELPQQPRHDAATVLVMEIDGAPLASVPRIQPDGNGVYRLAAAASERHGSTLIYPSGGGEDSVGNWTNPDEWVSWRLSVPEAGSYQVQITYGCDDGSGGTYRIAVADHALDGVVRPTGGWFQRRTESPGIIELPAAEGIELSVRVLEKTGLAIMDLSGIVLEPVDPAIVALMARDGHVAGEDVAPVTLDTTEESAILANGLVVLDFDLAEQTYSISDAQTGEVVLFNAGVARFQEVDSELTILDQKNVVDRFGRGRQLVLALRDWGWGARWGFRDAGYEIPNSMEAPVYLFTFTLYEGRSEVIMGFGVQTPKWYRPRLREAYPLARAQLFPGRTLAEPLTLNGTAGAEPPTVKAGLTRLSANSLMVTGLLDGERRTVVWGGLGNSEFGKYTAIRDGVLEMHAADPTGRLVDPGETYIAADTFYLDVTTAEPFEALEKYGRAMRLANDANPNVYDFPVLCGWGVGALSQLPDVNNSAKLIEELELAQKSGFTKYTKVAVRLEPDTYYFQDGGNTQQGWWDDEHWAKYGHLVPPYETFAKWCAAVVERDGVPYTYFQIGMPSDDYAEAFPGHMLFNDISMLDKPHRHHQPYVTFDYTDPDFQERTLAMWRRLRSEGMRGIKFDYPETGWRPEGGFEDKYATTTSAYRKAFQLAREGLGPDALLDERNLGESGRPCLDVTAGIVDTQRNWSDANNFEARMVSTGGLRWYKNRTVFNYYPDSKKIHDLSPEIRRSMLTMVYLTSGRIDLVTSFSLFTPEIVHDFSRIYPAYREPFTARPLDAFTGVADPQVYDLELTPDWRQIVLFNTGEETATVSVDLSGDRANGAIGLDPEAFFYAYDFWADRFIGRLDGTMRLEEELEPLHCAMISLRKVQDHPQVLSTNRHILQGWVDLENVKWNDATGQLSGTAQVVGGEAFRIVVANNGRTPTSVNAEGATARLEPHVAGEELSVIVLVRDSNGDVEWRLSHE